MNSGTDEPQGSCNSPKVTDFTFSFTGTLFYLFCELTGDDGINTEVQSGVLMKESENIYSLWCSGRTSVEGMLIELKLLKRQDLVNTIARLFRPATDQIVSMQVN